LAMATRRAAGTIVEVHTRPSEPCRRAPRAIGMDENAPRVDGAAPVAATALSELGDFRRN